MSSRSIASASSALGPRHALRAPWREAQGGSRSATRFTLLVVLCTLALLGGDAWAKKRVVVPPFGGRGTELVHDEVEEIVQGQHTLVSQSAWNRARKRIHGKLGDAGIARIASDLQVDAIVEGTFSKRSGGGYTLLLTVREGLTGAVADTVVVKVRATRLDSDSKRDLAEKLLPVLSSVGDVGATEPIEINPTAPIAEVDTEQPLAQGTPPPVATETAVTDEDRPPAGDERLSFRHNRHAAVDVQAGASAALRNLRFTFAPGLPNNQRPNGYKGSIVPSVMVTGELYPLELGAKGGGALAGLGIGFVFDKVLLLKSKLGMTEYSTSQTRYGAGLRYRYAFGDKATLPTIKLIAGWSHLDFTINRGSADLDLPNVKYSYLDLGAAVRFPLGTPNAAIYGDFRYMVVLGSGEITEEKYYGKGGVLGIDGDIGIELIFAKRAILRVGARYQRVAYDFDGTGDKAKNRDGDPMTQDVGGALDQYFSAYATAGYLF